MISADSLLKTKVYMPFTRKDLVSRPRLSARLAEGMQARAPDPGGCSGGFWENDSGGVTPYQIVACEPPGYPFEKAK